jgi:tetratricopeptide (TPR) repeat protein
MDDLHSKANNFYYNKNYSKAIDLYTHLINNLYKLDIMYSNRSACYLQLKNYTLSLHDGLKSIENNLNKSIAWGRIGYSYKGLNLNENAFKAFKIAHKFDKENNVYINEINYYLNKVNITNIYNLFKNDDKLFNMLLENKNDILNHKLNNNVLTLFDKIISKII